MSVIKVSDKRTQLMGSKEKCTVQNTQFRTDLSTGVCFRSEQKRAIVHDNGVWTVQDGFLSDKLNDAVKKTNSSTSTASLFYSISKSVVDFVAPNSVLDSSIDFNKHNDNINNVLLNLDNSEYCKEKLLLQNSIPETLATDRYNFLDGKRSRRYFSKISSRIQNRRSVPSDLLDSCLLGPDSFLSIYAVSFRPFLFHPNEGLQQRSPQYLEGLCHIGKSMVSQLWTNISNEQCFRNLSSSQPTGLANLNVLCGNEQNRYFKHEPGLCTSHSSNNDLEVDELSESVIPKTERQCSMSASLIGTKSWNIDPSEDNFRDRLSLTRFHQLINILQSNGANSQIPHIIKSDNGATNQSGLKEMSDDFHSGDNLKKQKRHSVSAGHILSTGCHIREARSLPLFPKINDNALAGALAGAFVSLCLHPIDTIKTIIQSRSAGSASLVHNLGSITSQRGLLGLYRGIGSNLASSAPISGTYTFTYETVKAALLPYLPKEYHGFAHCIAGGCASIATSFIYTPSECVKQRMQVGSHYCNSWRAFKDILKRGGLSLLYAGWGAVLCRNVPQSVIKFYTYEGLKESALSSQSPETNLSTIQTLLFGGLAGSTAALFTTPFDVIKTRLQTQAAMSHYHYEGVFQAFWHITQREGIGSLYRGLFPRLLIYISQGALFFASYETFKQAINITAHHLRLHSSDCAVANNVDQSMTGEPS